MIRGLSVPLEDGTVLAADLCRPDGAQPSPVLVSTYPYRKDDIIGSLFAGTRQRLAERGYATVFADMAGTGASDGGYGETFDLPREGGDCAAVVEWAAAQEWCDGNVGAWGVSYGGMTALAAAATRPPHLKAIVAVYATTDVYRDTITLGGCPAMLGRYAWAAHMMALGLCPPTDQDPAGRWRRVWDQRLRRLADGVPHAITWQAHQDREDEYWRDRVVDPSAIEIPAMLIGGWADAFASSMSSLYQAVRGPKRLVMGPWMHVLPHLSPVEPYDWVGEMAGWWDAHLRSAPTKTEDHALCYVRDDGWRATAQWPPDGGRELVLYPAGYRLGSEPPAEDTSRDYECDPSVGLAAGIFDPFGTGNGWPEEQSGDDARSLTYTGDPLPEPLVVAGRAQAVLRVECLSGGPAQLVARLASVTPDGRSTLISSGSARVTGEQLAAIPLTATAIRLPAGTRIRLSVACAEFPRIWPTPGNPVIRLLSGPDSSLLRLCVYETAGPPVSVPLPPAGPDPGWVSDDQPVYRTHQDKASGEVAVEFGASSRLRPPSGADLRLDERFTARVRAARPDGAALVAAVDVSLRLPAGERVEIAVRSTSSRTVTVIEGSVELDGACLLRRTWTNATGEE
jgi:putative CocE/NonD family hydrolase